MRAGFLSLAFLVSLGLAAPADLLGKRNSAENAGLNLRQKVETELANLERNMLHAGGLSAQFRFLEKTGRDIRSIRHKQARQSEVDEIFMDQLEAILTEIPNESNFRGQDCGDYRASLVMHFDPVADSAERNPALKAGLRILGHLCK